VFGRNHKVCVPNILEDAMIKKIASILLAGFFLLGLSCRLTGTSGQGYIVYTAVGEEEKPLPELVVLDAKGNELRRIKMPADEKYGNLYTAYPFHHTSHQVFVYTPGGKNYLIDVTSGEVKPVLEPSVTTIQDNTNPLYICPQSGHAGQHWALLCRGNTPYLVNLETAEVNQALSEPSVDQMVPFNSWFSPDETYFAIRTGDGTFILPAANPDRIRRLGESDKIPEVDFSSDSKRIAYVRQTESQGYEVIVENVDGSKSGVMHVSNNPTQVSFIPEHDQILVREKGIILLLSLSSRKEQEFPALEGFPVNVIFAPQGEQVLVGYNDLEAETTHWQWLELKHGSVEGLPELEGYQAGQVYTGQRWIILSDVTQIDEQAEIDMASVDLQTGSVQYLSTLVGANYFTETSVSADGKFRTGIAFSTGNQAEFWLLDLASGKSRRIVEDAVVSGGISPDGKWLVILSGHRAGGQYTGKIELQDTSGKVLKSLGDGFSPFWVWP
jgi:Tol biopolymer transport system component